MTPADFERVPARSRGAGLALLVALLGLAVGADAAEPPPEGLPVGPWVLTPSLVLGAGHDTNPFYVPEALGDNVFRADANLVANLPFRNSLLRLGYNADWINYATFSLARNLAQDFLADLQLNFSSSDQIRIQGERVLGVTDYLRFDPGGEAVFRGEPYNFDTASVEGSRAVYGQRGYRLRATWSHLNFPPSTTQTFLEYQGWEYAAEYKEPLSPSWWLLGGYAGRRFSYYQVQTGEIDRREDTDLLSVGMEGRIGNQQTIRVLSGWASFRFPIPLGSPSFDPARAQSSYRGLVLDFSADMAVAPGLTVRGTLVYRPWPSFFLDNNFYLLGAVGAQVEYRRPGGSTFGASMALLDAGYPETVIVDNSQLPGSQQVALKRTDRTLRGDVYANLMIRERMGFRLSVSFNHRTSNYVFAEYSQLVYFGGLTFGWF